MFKCPDLCPDSPARDNEKSACGNKKKRDIPAIN